jgi:RNA polymerase sigma factor (sigma-70 family)
MSDTSWIGLRQLLVERYYDLRDRLTRRLGSMDLASEALHEVYLRLDRIGDPGSVTHPAAYLFRAACNAANDALRIENRYARQRAASPLNDLPDRSPGPDDTVEARIELEVLASALMTLPRRQREILIAARYEQIPRAEIAKRYGISRRQVQIELQRALETCKDYLDKNG